MDAPHGDGPLYAGAIAHVTVAGARRDAAAAALERAASAAVGADVAIERRLCEGPLAERDRARDAGRPTCS